MYVRLRPPSSWILVSDGIYSVGGGHVVLGPIGVAPAEVGGWLRDVLATRLPAGATIEHDGTTDARVLGPDGAVIEQRSVTCLRFGGLAAAALVVNAAEHAAEIADTLAAARLPPASLSQLLAGFDKVDR